MLASELPESEYVVRSSNLGEIAAALREVLNGSLAAGYSNMAPISGESFSGRVLSPQPFLDTVGFRRTLLPTEMAGQLVHLGRWESRYDPIANPNQVKGWEIRRAMTEDGPIAIAWAVWVPAPTPKMPIFM